MHTLKIKRLRPGAELPCRATGASAGYDLCACLGEPLALPTGGMVRVPTGIAIEMEGPEQVAAFVFGRSGLGMKHGIVPSNAVGVIDADYRGEIIVGLSNHGGSDYTIQPGERIAQLLILPVIAPSVVEVEELSDTARGVGGFGSTGK